MTPFFKVWFCSILFLGSTRSWSELQGKSQQLVRYMDIHGLAASDRDWFLAIVDLQLPRNLSAEDLKHLRDRILATRIFSYADAQIDGDRVRITVEEKWTFIPVARGKVGGGTPLLVLGAYESHFLGKQMTLGAEMRRYGGSSPGFSAFTQLPHLLGRHTLLGLEVSRLHRVREFYNDRREYVGDLNSDEENFQVIYLAPLSLSNPRLRLGLDLRNRNLNVRFQNGNSQSLSDLEKYNERYSILPTLEYDDIVADNLKYEGVRSVNKFGVLFGGERILYPVLNLELFYYRNFFENYNLSWHGFLGASDGRSLQAQYF